MSSEAVSALRRIGIVEPTPIQHTVIPDALAGRDVLGKAPTGSGKTFAFGLPLLELVERAEPRRPRGLVLAPTRELALQINRELAPVAATLGRTMVTIYGGVGMSQQINALRSGSDVVIATPGRLLDLIDQGEVALDRVDRVVVDEADRMADMGFLPSVRQILDLTASSRQTVLFSATLDAAVEVLIEHYQNDPATHSHGGDEPDITQMSHRFLRVASKDKVAVAADIIDGHGSTMVFCRTRHGVDRVCRQLKRLGVKAAWIHGGRSQNQRTAALLAFTDGRAQALVATDVAARGIHVDEVACVLHFDPPADAKDYVHRSGRTARAGYAGDVICLVTDDQMQKVRSLIRRVGLEARFEDAETPTERVGLPSHGPERKARSRSTRREASDESAAKPNKKRAKKGTGAKKSSSRAGKNRRKPAPGSGTAKPRSRRSGKPRPKAKSARKAGYKNRGTRGRR
ncbi:MAG: DEAD/DEAH box helicase [Acidimicrobiales bacterium]|nr:DEAD/DEAH box helicase [Acidimicrobiales bacterium]